MDHQVDKPGPATGPPADTEVGNASDRNDTHLTPAGGSGVTEPGDAEPDEVTGHPV